MFDIDAIHKQLAQLLSPLQKGWEKAEIWLGRKTFPCANGCAPSAALITTGMSMLPRIF